MELRAIGVPDGLRVRVFFEVGDDVSWENGHVTHSSQWRYV